MPTLAHGRLVAAISTRQVGVLHHRNRKSLKWFILSFDALARKLLAAISRSTFVKLLLLAEISAIRKGKARLAGG
jgi:hypothetical protein